MRSLEARVDRLEEKMGTKDNKPMLLIIRAMVGCDADKQGAERQIHYDPIGLRSTQDGRYWPREPGETSDEMTARVERDLLSDGRKVHMVCEVYAV